MGLSFGSQQSQTSGATSSNQSNAYSPAQVAIQSATGSTLSQDLAASNAGTLTPGNTAALTATNNQTNATSGGLTDRVNQLLAARGFGKSGTTGQTTLQGELGRESQIGTNTANAYNVQGQQNTQNLLAALNYAFTSLGSSSSGTTSGTSSGSNFGADAAFSYGE